jgi:hypothetical protein
MPRIVFPVAGAKLVGDHSRFRLGANSEIIFVLASRCQSHNLNTTSPFMFRPIGRQPFDR